MELRMGERIPTWLFRLIALTAAIPIFWLREEFDSRPRFVFLMLFFYMAVNLVLALWPRNWGGFRIGLGIGYPLSLNFALLLYLHARGGVLMPTFPPTPPPPVVAYRVVLCLNVVLFLASSAALIVRGKRILSDLLGLALGFVSGLVYPFVAFAAVAVLGQI